MIIQQAEALARQCTYVEGLRTHASQLGKYQDKAKLFAGLAEALEPLVKKAIFLESKGIVRLEATAQATGLLRQLEITVSAFNENSGWLIRDSGGFNAAAFKAASTSLRTKLTDLLKNSWATRLSEHVQKPTTETSRLFEVFKKIAPLRHIVEQIESLTGEINASEPPQTELELEIIEQKFDQLKSLWAMLRSGHVPEGAVRFLSAAATGGATIELLTEETKQWLIQQGIAQYFRIKLSS